MEGSSPWGGDDAEHPADITMDTPPPRGPLTRAQACAIGTKVNSLLSELHFDTCETWVLPHADMLCIIRYQGDVQGEAMEQGRATPEEELREDEARKILVYRDRYYRPRERYYRTMSGTTGLSGTTVY